jgi:hypothetical protein
MTSDLDVMEPHLRPYLQTYLPFILAVPFGTLALFLTSVLRAANRPLSGALVSSYSVNVMLFAACSLGRESEETSLFYLSWAFFIGTALAAAMGVLITQRVFKAPRLPAPAKLDSGSWAEVYTMAAANGFTGIALACLQWSSVCILAVLGTEVQIAEYAVVARTALIISFLIPAAVRVPQALQSRLAKTLHTSRGKLLIDIFVSSATTTACVLAVVLVMPRIFEAYGPAYSGLSALIFILFTTQAVNGAAGPAIRRIAADWDLPRLRRMLLVSMTFSIVASVVGIWQYGALAAAVGVLVGALSLNGQALVTSISSTKSKRESLSTS